MARKYLLSLLFCLVALFACAGQSALAADTAWQDPFYSGSFGQRTWTDVTGDHRVDARFVELLPEKIVRLQRPNGKFLRIKLAELSRADRELVSQIAR